MRKAREPVGCSLNASGAARLFAASRGAGWNRIVIAFTPGSQRAVEDRARIERAFD
jgi:hypothetical protein